MPFIAALAATLLAATPTTQKRDVTAFDTLEVASAIEATVVQGTTPSLVISVDKPELLERVKTERAGGTLRISMESKGLGCWVDCKVKVVITTPSLQKLGLEGAAKADLQGKFGPTLAVRAAGASVLDARGVAMEAVELEGSGASRLVLEGAAAALKVDASGATVVDTRKLEAKHVKANVSGASTAKLTAKVRVGGEASGASTVSVAGAPAERAFETSGSSSVVYEK